MLGILRIVAAVTAALAAGTVSAAEKGGQAAPLLLDGPASAAPWQRYADWPQARWDRFNTLGSVASPPAPPPGQPIKTAGPLVGDADRGMKLAFDRSRGGSCVACHVMGAKTPAMPGNVGPDLSAIGKAGFSDDYLFNSVFDRRIYNPETVMPPWGTNGMYTPAEVADVVAFLKSLTVPVAFADPLEDPLRRPVPEETRDNLDVFTNPGMEVVEKGEGLYKQPGPTGKACASCHAAPERRFRTWAARMPRWEPRLNKVVGVSEFIYRHAAATSGARWLMQSDQNSAMAVYLTYLANGQPITPALGTKAARAALKRGEALTHRKIGQLNFSCLDCHAPDKGANKWIRGQWLGEQRGQLDHFPTWRTSRQEVWDIRKRFQWCGVAIRADELPPEAPEYGDLELYLTSLNKGLKIDVPGIRH